MKESNINIEENPGPIGVIAHELQKKSKEEKEDFIKKLIGTMSDKYRENKEMVKYTKNVVEPSLRKYLGLPLESPKAE